MIHFEKKTEQLYEMQMEEKMVLVFKKIVSDFVKFPNDKLFIHILCTYL